MYNYKEFRNEKFFICDKCGKGYSFVNAYLAVSKGDKYCTAYSDEILIADQDLCRDCAGQTDKFPSGAEATLQVEIQEIVEAA